MQSIGLEGRQLVIFDKDSREFDFYFNDRGEPTSIRIVTPRAKHPVIFRLGHSHFLPQKWNRASCVVVELEPKEFQDKLRSAIRVATGA